MAHKMKAMLTMTDLGKSDCDMEVIFLSDLLCKATLRTIQIK